MTLNRAENVVFMIDDFYTYQSAVSVTVSVSNVRNKIAPFEHTQHDDINYWSEIKISIQ